MTRIVEALTGRVPLDNAQLGRLGQLTGWDFAAQRSFSGCRGPDVSFDRPELSPCLAPFQDRNDPKYEEALAIIGAGKENLAKRPRGDDLEGFESVLQGHDLPRDDQLHFITEAEHVHSSSDVYARMFQELQTRLGIDGGY